MLTPLIYAATPDDADTPRHAAVDAAAAAITPAIFRLLPRYAIIIFHARLSLPISR